MTAPDRIRQKYFCGDDLYYENAQDCVAFDRNFECLLPVQPRGKELIA